MRPLNLTLSLRLAMSLFMAVGALALSGCNKDEGGSGGGAVTPQFPPYQPGNMPYPGGPNGPYGQRLHKPQECPVSLLGRFRNVAPNARAADRFMTLDIGRQGEMILSWGARPRQDRFSTLAINGMQQTFRANRIQWSSRAICEAGRIVIVTNSQRLDSPAQEWVLSTISPSSPTSMRIDVNINGAPTGQMQFNRTQAGGGRDDDYEDDGRYDDDLNEGEYEEVDPEDRTPDRRDRNERERREQDRDREVRPRPVPPRVIVPPRKEVPPRRVTPMPPKRQEPPRVTPAPRPAPPKKEVPPKREVPPKKETPPDKVPPKRTTPPQSEVDPSGCPFILGEYALVGDDSRMPLALVAFRRNESGVLIMGGKSGDTKLPDIILDGETRAYGTAESAGGSVTGLCSKGSIVIKRIMSDKSELRLDVTKTSGSEVTIKSARANEVKTFRYAKKK